MQANLLWEPVNAGCKGGRASKKRTSTVRIFTEDAEGRYTEATKDIHRRDGVMKKRCTGKRKCWQIVAASNGKQCAVLQSEIGL